MSSAEREGGHVWIFFEQPYPAVRSRKIIASLLEKTGGFSIFDKGSSFDRLFPNQDFLSGKGLGNLIALPLHSTALMPEHGPLVEEDKNCFFEPETLEPYADQWKFLEGIQKVPAAHLDWIYESLRHSTQAAADKSQAQQTGGLAITLSNVIRLNRSGLNAALIDFLKEELNYEIENDYIRPEFEVLKPYFSKVIGSDKVEVEIHAEIENGELVAQMASCPELERINREIIESVKFRFFDEALVGGKLPSSESTGLPGLEQQHEEGNIEKLYGLEEELLEYALKKTNARHYKQLRFLAEKHQGSILKLRFVLNPF